MFMDLIDSEWSYHSFDPIESEQVLDQLVTRYRKVTLPSGLDNWFESGHSSPIGSKDSLLATTWVSCLMAYP